MKEKFKVLSEGMTSGKFFSYFVESIEKKVEQNKSIDMDSLEYNNLFQLYLRKFMLNPSPEIIKVLLILGVIIAVCSDNEDYKPLTIAEVSYLSLYYEEKSLNKEDIEKLNNDLINMYDKITDKKFTWSKFGINETLVN